MRPLVSQETGEIDATAIAEHRDPSWARERAAAERRQWQRARGLPVDGESPAEMVMVCGYGAGADGFGYSFGRAG